MADGKSGFKRALAVDIAKPTHQEASEVEDFPSPPPLYTPTTKELEETLDKEMADKKPAFTKSLSLSIDRPTDKAAEENEPPPVDPMPTPSQKEIENMFDEEMKQATPAVPEKDEHSADNGHEGGLSKSQKKKAKKKAKKAETSKEDDPSESAPEPRAYVPGSQWEPDDDDDDDKDDDDLCVRKPSVDVAPPPPTTEKPPAAAEPDAPEHPEPRAYVPGSQWEPEDEDDSFEVTADHLKPTATSEPVDESSGTAPEDKSDAPAPQAPDAPATPASADGAAGGKPAAAVTPSPKKAELKPDSFFLKSNSSAASSASTPKPVPSKLSTEMISKFAAAEAPQPVALSRTPSGSTKKWAPVPAPVPRKSLTGLWPEAEEKHVDVPPMDPDVPEPTDPVEYKNLLAGDPGSWPKGIRADKREKYLSDAEFQDVFGMGKAEFSKLRQWKKKELKKAVKLF